MHITIHYYMLFITYCSVHAVHTVYFAIRLLLSLLISSSEWSQCSLPFPLYSPIFACCFPFYSLWIDYLHHSLTLLISISHDTSPPFPSLLDSSFSRFISFSPSFSHNPSTFSLPSPFFLSSLSLPPSLLPLPSLFTLHSSFTSPSLSPACLHLRIASATSGRAGSLMPQKPYE